MSQHALVTYHQPVLYIFIGQVIWSSSKVAVERLDGTDKWWRQCHVAVTVVSCQQLCQRCLGPRNFHVNFLHCRLQLAHRLHQHQSINRSINQSINRLWVSEELNPTGQNFEKQFSCNKTRHSERISTTCLVVLTQQKSIPVTQASSKWRSKVNQGQYRTGWDRRSCLSF